MMTQPIKLMELFGGIGADRKALVNLRIPHIVVGYVEVDKYAVRSYNEIFKEHHYHQPESIVGWDNCPDLLVHGSPCQSFSISGKGEGGDEDSGTKSSLMWETIRILKSFSRKPSVVIWENVEHIMSVDHVDNFRRYLSEMEGMGYTNSFDVLNAINFGLPQNRRRTFTISTLNGKKFDFDSLLTEKAPHINQFLEKDVDDRYTVTQPSILSKIYKEDVFKINIIGDRCNTITTTQMRCPNSGVVQIGDDKYRYLTELECWRLQGFSDEDYYRALSVNPLRANGKLSKILYRQAGNSIPVTIFESIFRNLYWNQKRYY